jgi:hypothetical protein
MTSYTRQQTERWLAWQMTQHSQSVLYPERMQPDWLPQQQQRGPTLGAGLLAGLLFGLDVALPITLDLGLFSGLKKALIAGLLFGLGTIAAFRYPL